MKNVTFLIFLFIASCAPFSPQKSNLKATTTSSALSSSQKKIIGRKIWQNESGASIAGLTAWNDGETFPSLGIGHLIWYPKGRRAGFTESFPQFIHYARQRKTPNIPPVALQAACPWPNKAAFERDKQSPPMQALRQWLASTIALQTDFIILKSKSALPSLLRVAPADDRARIQANYQKVSTTPNGTYALIDYVNFKGEGTNPKERYKGQGWGLLQVLAEMRNTTPGQAAAQEFSQAAKRTLLRRITNSPPARGEQRWKAGWLNRCNTYAQPF